MTPYFKILLLLLLSNWSFAQSGDLFSIENSKKFADHLFKSGNYEQAAVEYERLLVIDSATSKSYQYRALVCYRKANKLAIGFERFTKWFTNENDLAYPLSKEYSLYMTGQGFYADAISFLNQTAFPNQSEKDLLLALNYCYLGKWDEAKEKTNNVDEESLMKDILKVTIESGLSLKLKSPGLAATLAIIPGLGRLYTGNYVDAGLSVITIGTFTWQAYMGFDKNGIKSAYGWIVGSIGAGFYFGNIYGSYRAAQLHNKQKLEDIIAQIDRAYGLIA